MLTVLKAEINSRQGVVTVRGDGQEEVGSALSRQLAIDEATRQGLSRVGISGSANIFPVDAEGNTGDDLIAGRIPVAGYHAEWPVTAMI